MTIDKAVNAIIIILLGNYLPHTKAELRILTLIKVFYINITQKSQSPKRHIFRLLVSSGDKQRSLWMFARFEMCETSEQLLVDMSLTSHEVSGWRHLWLWRPEEGEAEGFKVSAQQAEPDSHC